MSGHFLNCYKKPVFHWYIIYIKSCSNSANFNEKIDIFAFRIAGVIVTKLFAGKHFLGDYNAPIFFTHYLNACKMSVRQWLKSEHFLKFPTVHLIGLCRLILSPNCFSSTLWDAVFFPRQNFIWPLFFSRWNVHKNNWTQFSKIRVL